MSTPLTVEEFCEFNRDTVKLGIREQVAEAKNNSKVAHVTLRLGHIPNIANQNDDTRKQFERDAEAMIQEVIQETLPGNASVPVYGQWIKETPRDYGRRRMDESDLGHRYLVTFTVWRFTP